MARATQVTGHVNKIHSAIQKDTRTHILRAHFHHQFSVSTKKGPYNNGEAIKDDIKFENIKIVAVRVCARAWAPRMDYYEFYVVCLFSFIFIHAKHNLSLRLWPFSSISPFPTHSFPDRKKVNFRSALDIIFNAFDRARSHFIFKSNQ